MFLQTVSHLTAVLTVSVSICTYTHTLSIITAKGIKMKRAYDSLSLYWVSDQWHLCLPEIIKICACLGVWLNSFTLCKCDKGFYDCVGSWIILFTVCEGIWQLYDLEWKFKILIFYHATSQLFFQFRAVTNSVIVLEWKSTYTFTERLLICLVTQMQTFTFYLYDTCRGYASLSQACILNKLSWAHKMLWGILSTA